jgi:hypothetical protein
VRMSALWVSEEARERASVSRRRPRSAGCGHGQEGSGASEWGDDALGGVLEVEGEGEPES